MHHALPYVDQAHMLFFLLKHASVLYINSIYVIFSPLNTQVRVLLSESAHAYVVAHPIFPISVMWQLCQPFVTWFLLSLSDHFSPIGNRNQGQQFKTSRSVVFLGHMP
jgi:hypothetical protein